MNEISNGAKDDQRRHAPRGLSEIQSLPKAYGSVLKWLICQGFLVVNLSGRSCRKQSQNKKLRRQHNSLLLSHSLSSLIKLLGTVGQLFCSAAFCDKMKLTSQGWCAPML